MALAVLWEILTMRTFCRKMVGSSVTLTGSPVWDVLTACVKSNYPKISVELLFFRRQGKPKPPVFCTCTNSLCLEWQ